MLLRRGGSMKAALVRWRTEAKELMGSTDEAAGGHTRRDVLRKAAIAGAVAWGTPLVTSMNTPASAQVSIAAGNYRQYYTLGGTCEATTFVRTNPSPNGLGCTSPSNWNNIPEYTATVNWVQNVAAQTYVVSLTAPNCSFEVTAQGRNTSQCGPNGNVCVDATHAMGSQTSTFDYNALTNSCPDTSSTDGTGSCLNGDLFPPFDYLKLLMVCT